MKWITLLVLFLVLLSAAAVAAVVTFSMQDDEEESEAYATYGTHLGLSEEMEAEIKQDYLAFRNTLYYYPYATTDDVTIIYYQGTYDGCVVALMTSIGSQYAQVVTEEIIDGVTFYYSDANKSVAWKDGNFHYMREAYGMGILTHDDLVMISKCAGYWKTEKPMRQDYVDTYVKQNDPDATADRVWIDRYYGTYDGLVVSLMWYYYAETVPGITEVRVADSLFIYEDRHSIITWKDGSFFELQDAYDQGLLTDDDVVWIAEFHREAHPSLYQ